MPDLPWGGCLHLLKFIMFSFGFFIFLFLISIVLPYALGCLNIQESLSTQFWDGESFVDGPIRSLLYMLENEFPYRSVKLLRFLSAVSEGKWSAECVYVLPLDFCFCLFNMKNSNALSLYIYICMYIIFLISWIQMFSFCFFC